MRWVKFFFSFLITLALGGALLIPFGSLPFAPGSFFDPFVGFWANAERFDDSSRQVKSLSFPQLREEVKVRIDQRGVPHIFAQHPEDLYFVQGYLTAKDRLWQMEFQTMAAAGRLTEIVGRGAEDRVLNLDRQARRKGLVYGAESSLEKMKEDPASMLAIESYAQGINAYINSLEQGQLPIEYKLLGYQPEPWTPLKSALLLKYMANSLTWRSYDIPYTHSLYLMGKDVFEVLYPDRFPTQSPIIPESKRWDRRLADPKPQVPQDYQPDSILIKGGFKEEEVDPIIGSNNWAISPQKSKSGNALLANDPHLPLNLPALWYEVQLHGPGQNVYGASLPGSPGVIIGFNNSIAWGVTNGSRDVVDHYTITYRDDRKRDYYHNGQWLPVKNRIEEFKVKNGESYFDTVRYTHIGPVMYEENFAPKGKPLAIRWMAHEPSNELKTFLNLNQAHNYEDYLKAISEYVCPAQNFVFASTKGNIAIWQQGKFPNKWIDQGKFILDGSRREHMWESYIPQNQNPHIFNPEQGFVQSANQHPTTEAYPYETDGRYEDFRGRRLYNLLSSRDSLDVEDMKAFQLDNYYQGAADILPFLLSELDTLSLDRRERKIYDDLKTWDYNYDHEDYEPTVFEVWWSTLYRNVWRDEFSSSPLALTYPKTRTFMYILQDSVEFSFYQVSGDSTRYDRKDWIRKSFDQALAELNEKSENPGDWAWHSQKKTNINHLSKILTPFGREGLLTDGNGGILNAAGKESGPSWRMIVELGTPIKAYGIYPGGQSGNPGSHTYDAFIDDWVDGKYYELKFYSGPEVEDAESGQTITFKKP